MRNDLIFNYDYLINKISNKYKGITLNKNLNSFCKEVNNFSLYKLKMIMMNRIYFSNNDIVKISKVLSLSREEIIKCFLTLEK